jgi:cytochrome P450
MMDSQVSAGRVPRGPVGPTWLPELDWLDPVLARKPAARLIFRSGQLNPYPVYRDLLDGEPVFPVFYGGMGVARHDICAAILADRRFGAIEGRHGPFPAADLTDPEFSLLGLNPPEHTRLRRLIMPSFGKKQIASRFGLVKDVVDPLLRRARERGTFDFIEEVAAPVSVGLTRAIFDVPPEREDELMELGTTVSRSMRGVITGEQADRIVTASRRLKTLFGDVIAGRSRPGTSDVIDRLLLARDDGQIVRAEIIGLCELLVIASVETTKNVLGNCLLALLSDRGQWQALTADPALAGPAVEETLRFDPTVQWTWRVALADIPDIGEGIPKGTNMSLMLGASGRDGSVWDSPDTFDITRPGPSSHLGFSAGEHYCAGAGLARMTSQYVLAELSAMAPALRIAGSPKRIMSIAIRGLESLPVSID